MPVTSSVTVCSTWRRGLASMKANSASSSPRIGVDQELERAKAVVTDRFGHLHRRRGEAVAQALGRAGTGRDFDQLLIAPLDGAFALPQMADAAGAVAGYLDFEMARTRHQTLHVYVGIAEGRPRLGLASPIRLVQFVESSSPRASRGRLRRRPP